MKTNKTSYMLPLYMAAILLTSGCMSPLRKAVDRNDAAAVVELIDQGADINKTSAPYGMTALAHAASKGNLELARVLLDKGANVDAKGTGSGGWWDGWTPLCWAAHTANVSVARLLMARGADADEAIAKLRRSKNYGYVDAIELINGLRKTSAPAQGLEASSGTPSAMPLPLENVAPF